MALAIISMRMAQRSGCGKKMDMTWRCNQKDHVLKEYQMIWPFWVKIGHSSLTRAAIDSGQLMKTDHVDAAQLLLKEMFPSVEGMQTPLSC